MIKPITQIPHKEDIRYSSGFPGFDGLLGGGFVDGECLMFAGEPGVGKSTLLTQLCYNFASSGNKVLYVSGEESLSQIRLRADRLGTLHPYFMCSDSRKIEDIFVEVEKYKPKMLIVDSLQMVSSSDLKQEPGNARQMKYCLDKLITFAKNRDIILITIGHSTKSGLIAGLLTLQHMVDGVFFMTKDDENETARVTLARKNRFGSTQTSWITHMSKMGLSDTVRAGSHFDPRELNWTPFSGRWGYILNPIHWGAMLIAMLIGGLLGLVGIKVDKQL